MTEDEIKELSQLPGINTALIEEKFNAGPDGLKYLLTLFDFMQRSKTRAENLALVYQRQMLVLHQKLDEARDGIVVSKPRKVITEDPTPKAKVQAAVVVSKKEKPMKGSVIDIQL